MQPTVASALAALACSVSGCDEKTNTVAAPRRLPAVHGPARAQLAVAFVQGCSTWCQLALTRTAVIRILAPTRFASPRAEPDAISASLPRVRLPSA